MPPRRLIVIGASAGGVTSLAQLVRGLDAGLPAAVLIVLHTAPFGRRSALPEILARAGPLRAAIATHGADLKEGCILIAPADYHMRVVDGRVELDQGPRESHARPAIDPLFRTAARAYRRDVAGVILSGTQGDGTIGLMAIKSYGGLAIVQDPDEIQYSAMPRRALQYVSVDHVLSVHDIGATLNDFASSDRLPEAGIDPATAGAASATIVRDMSGQIRGELAGGLSMYSCPECGGTLWQTETGELTQFHCHVGHTYSPELLLVEKTEGLETALWSAVRTLVEKATLTRQLAQRSRDSGNHEKAAAIEEQALIDEAHVRLIRDAILNGMSNPRSAAHAVDDVLREDSSEPAE
jgi:two-component system, chemotaxis family, protein-glutamate methylesterase/glutaminase